MAISTTRHGVARELTDPRTPSRNRVVRAATYEISRFGDGLYARCCTKKMPSSWVSACPQVVPVEVVIDSLRIGSALLVEWLMEIRTTTTITLLPSPVSDWMICQSRRWRNIKMAATVRGKDRATRIPRVAWRVWCHR